MIAAIMKNPEVSTSLGGQLQPVAKGRIPWGSHLESSSNETDASQMLLSLLFISPGDSEGFVLEV